MSAPGRWGRALSEQVDVYGPADGPPPARLLAFFGWCLKGGFGVIAAGSVISALAGVMEVASAFVLGHVIDRAIALGPERMLEEGWPLFALLFGFFMLARPLVMGASSAMSAIAIGPNINPLVLQRLHRYTMGHSVSFFDNDFAGRIAQKQMQTARAVTDVVIEFVNVVVFSVATLLGAAALMTSISGMVAGLLSVWLVLYAGLIRWFLPRVRGRSKARAGARAMVSGQVVDTITNIKTVKLFARAENEDQAALGAMETFRTAAVAFGRLASSFRIALMTLAGALPVILIGTTLVLWSQGTASAGDIAAAGAIALRIAQMTGWVSFALMSVYASLGEVEDGMRTLTPAWGLADRPGARDIGPVRGAIAFRDVAFTYGEAEGTGLHGVTLEVAPGEKIGLVGASGAGKSTLVSLLLRLHDVEAGAITVDGHDLRDVTQASLRRQISLVTQEAALFNRSARDNILYGRPDASEAEMRDAARRAHADGFIALLRDPKGRQGYDAHVGERGVKLSGGQRQRVALARVILKDAPILVLDEATSALDSEVEAAIQDALEEVMQGKTVIAIAHRLSTIARMDRIVVLEAGRIAEAGTHSELLARGGLYARFWARQSGGFIGTEAAAE